MKITIVTVCYNSQETIGETIRSVISQDYKDVEYIVIDGGSTDNTMQVVDQYSTKISRILSEKDEGLYFALNKGISLANGDVIGFLHSDDFYPNNGILSKINATFQSNNCLGVYGDLEYVSKDTNKVVRKWVSGIYSKGMFLKGWMPPHPTFFVKRECYNQYGNFNTILRSAADYELMLRLIHKNNISIAYLPEVLVKMRLGGKSNVSLSNRIKANREDRLAWKLNGIKPAPFTFLRKPLSKIGQFFK